MWQGLLTFLENFIIGKIESNAGHPDQLGWIKQALNLIALVGSAPLEAYAVPRLEGWIKSAAGNPIEHELVELAATALVKNGGEIGKIVGEADALADAPTSPPSIAEAVAPVDPTTATESTPTEPVVEATEAPAVEATEPATDPVPETPPTE